MDKDKYKLGKTRDEKPEGFYDTCLLYTSDAADE